MATYEVSITDGVGGGSAFATLSPALTEAVDVTDAYPIGVETTIIEAVDGGDAVSTLSPALTEAVDVTDAYPLGVGTTIVEAMEVTDTFATLSPALTEAVEGTDVYQLGVSIFLTEAADVTDANQIGVETTIIEATEVTEAISWAYVHVLEDTYAMWEALGWGWNKTIADTFAAADSLSKILGIPVIEALTLIDAQSNNWNGGEPISDLIVFVDLPSVVETFADLVADGMDAADAVTLALRLVITDLLTCVDAASNTGSFQFTAAEDMTLEDYVIKAFPKTIADTFASTDTNSLDFLLLLSIADTFASTDAATRVLSIAKTITDALAAADTITLQQTLQGLIEDGLAFDISIEMDDELWECWVLNTAAFHPSIYSGYDYNSYAIFPPNDGIVYGCRSDGIYELSGTTDNGTKIRSGIVLPDTRFESSHNKRFRKAFLGVSGDDFIMKVETESGDKTYRMTDTEVNLTRDMKGRSWKFSFEGFDDLDSILLFPVILSKK